MNADNALLTSSDYEQIVEDLKYDPNLEDYKLSPLHIDESFIPIQENGLKPNNQLQSQVNGQLQLFENYESVQNVLQNAMIQNNVVQELDQNVPVSPQTPTGAIPCRDQFPGPLNFQILLDSKGAGKQSWVYSHDLSKVFIDMFKSLIIKFQISEIVDGLHVRALPVYTMADYVSVPVQRCTVHEVADDYMREAHTENPNQCFCHKFQFVRHVVRSAHPRALYDYDCESDRHSVVVPLDCPQAGSNITEVEYSFSCKTSCPRGMNRKPIEVIFTLETEQCEVLGRCVMPVKICSCPKRDKEKEELLAAQEGYNPNPGKRRLSSSLDKSQSTKKIKTNNSPHVEVNEEPLVGENVLAANTQQIQADFSKIKEDIACVKEEISNKMSIKISNIENKQEELAFKIEKIQVKQEEMALKMDKIENLVMGLYPILKPF